MTTNTEYHASPRLSKSKLDLIDKAPALYKYRIIDGNKRPETPALAAGTAVHMFCFEPHLLPSTYWVFDDAAKVAEIGGAKPRNTSAYQLWKAEQLQANAGKLHWIPTTCKLIRACSVRSSRIQSSRNT